MIYKILNNLAPEYLSDLFYVYKSFRKNLRSENDHTIINIGHHIEKTISQKMCVIWNSLPIDLRSGNHLNAFKKNLKTCVNKLFFISFDICDAFLLFLSYLT